jgi:hypothetical protein
MAVEGNIEDISLLGFMQIVCMERRRAGLFLRRRGEEGAIFFEDGQVVHAATGNLVGEDALYKLLGWGEGRFLLRDQTAIPARTISKDLNYLILEGVKRIDEEHRPAPHKPQEGKPMAAAADQQLEIDLIGLISKLEQIMVRIADKRVQKQPQLAIPLLLEIANTVVAFSNALASGPNLTEVLASMDCRPLFVHDGRIRIRNAISNGHGQPGNLQSISNEVLRIIERYLASFRDRFLAEAMRQQWEETYGVFMTDLKAALNKTFMEGIQ